MTRRFLMLAAAWLGALWSRSPVRGAQSEDTDVEFRHGVASGDPTDSAVILWTRVSPQANVDAVAVDWVLARDPDLDDVVSEGRVSTSARRDWTVKVDAQGLEAAFLFPTVGVCVEHFMKDDVEQLYANVRAFNAWLDEAGTEPGRHDRHRSLVTEG